MAQEKYQNRGVPWYSPTTIPAIDLSPNAGEEQMQPDAREKAEKAAFSKRQIARRRYLLDKFPVGTRFSIWVQVYEEAPREDWRAPRQVIRDEMIRLTGVVRRFSKPTWGGFMVLVDWDPGQEKYRTYLGASTFCDYAFRMIPLLVIQ